MRNIQLVLSLWLLSFTAYGQQCVPPQSMIDINGNNIRARVLNRGDLFTDGANAQFIPNYNASSPVDQPSTIFTAGLWMGGLDAAGDLRLAAATYRQSAKSDYWAGPLDLSGQTSGDVCANWDKHFLVKKTEVDAFLAALPLSPGQAIAQFPSIMGWPGIGNPYFGSVNGFDLPFTSQRLAPFFDQDNDALYDPLAGDYPVVELRGLPLFVPTEMTWCVFNDQGGGAVHSLSQGKPIGMEIQQTVWAMKSTSLPALNNTVFTSHRLIYRGTEAIDSFSVGMWVDFDLGCYEDDYVGCNPALNTFYAYNTDPVDGLPGNSCQGTPTFTDSIPVQSVTFLDRSMDKFLTSSATPQTEVIAAQTDEFYNLLNGHWKDGEALTSGGSGIGGTTPADYAFSGDPADPDSWSMCTAGIAVGDRRALGASKMGEMLPGMINEMTLAWSVHYGGPPPCNLGNTFSDVEDIISVYNNGFTTDVHAPKAQPIAFSVTPNPAFDKIRLNYGEADVREIRIFDLSGRLMQSVSVNTPNQTDVRVENLPTGIFAVQVLGKSGVGVQKITIFR